MDEVKGRSYDASSRRARAERTSRAIVETARELFLDGGYAETRLRDVADACGVSVESVYKRFGGKPGLVRAVVARALLGSGDVPAETRSDELGDADGAELLRGWSRLSAEVGPLVHPILLLVRSAASHDPDLRALADGLDATRRTRMRVNATRLADAGHLRAGVTVDAAAEVLWTYSSPELYDLLVLRSGWDLDRYADFLVEGMSAHLV